MAYNANALLIAMSLTVQSAAFHVKWFIHLHNWNLLVYASMANAKKYNDCLDPVSNPGLISTKVLKS